MDHVRGGDHELEPVELIDLTGARVVVDADDVGLRVAAADLAEHALADDVVGQAAEGLAAHDVRRAVLDELDHLRGQQPPLARLVAQGEDLRGLVHHVGAGGLDVEGPPAGGERRPRRRLDLLQEPDGGLVPGHGIHSDAVGVGLPLGGDRTAEEEGEQPRNDGLAALGLDLIDDVIVGVGLEFDQNLSDDADARLTGDIAPGQGVELADHLAQQTPIAQPPAPGGAASPAPEEFPDDRIPPFYEAVGSPLLGLVGAHAQQAGVEGVADDDALDDLERESRSDLEPGVLLDALQGDGQDGDLGVAGVVQALAEHAGVVGSTAHAAGLGDGDDAAVGVVGPVLESPDELADDHDRGEAGIVVDVAQADVKILPTGLFEQLDLVAQASHKRCERTEMNRTHLRHEDRVGGAHLLGERRGAGAGQLARRARRSRRAVRARGGAAPDATCGAGRARRRRGGAVGQARIDLDGVVLQIRRRPPCAAGSDV